MGTITQATREAPMEEIVRTCHQGSEGWLYCQPCSRYCAITLVPLVSFFSAKNSVILRNLSALAGFLTADPLWAEVYAPNGTLLKPGDKVFRKVTTVQTLFDTILY